MDSIEMKAPKIRLIARKDADAMGKEWENAAELGYKVEFHDVPDQPQMLKPVWY